MRRRLRGAMPGSGVVGGPPEAGEQGVGVRRARTMKGLREGGGRRTAPPWGVGGDALGVPHRAPPAVPAPVASATLAALVVGALAVLAPAALLPHPAAAQETHVVVVAGLGGTQEYRDEFRTWTEELHAALVEDRNVPAERITVLTEEPDATPVAEHRSTRAELLRELGELAGRAGRDDRIVVVLIGHGTARGDEARFNLPGPDLGPGDFAGALAAFPTQELALVHTGSASGGFLAPLSGPRRVVVTATRTARERNATEFPRFFVDALRGQGADLDKDGRVSLLEAFQYASLETARFYDAEGEILTEHAVLDDDGDGEGSRDPGMDAPDGRLAAAFHFGTTRGGAVTDAPAEATDDPVLARLYQERTGIQERIDALRDRKDALGQEEYDEALEALLVELALVNREIRAREGEGG